MLLKYTSAILKHCKSSLCPVLESWLKETFLELFLFIIIHYFYYYYYWHYLYLDSHLHITNIIRIETSYSRLLNKSFAQVVQINLYVSKLFHYEISDEKKDSLNKAFESNVQSRNH